MPVFKDFSENGELLNTRDETLNEANLQRYIEENSIEKAQGYLDALEDIEKQFKNFIEIHSSNSWRYNTAYKVSKGCIDVYEEKHLFIEVLKKYIRP